MGDLLESRVKNKEYIQRQDNEVISSAFTLGYGDGPHAVVVGATHGNEPAGVEALVRYHQHLTQVNAHIRGRITFLIGNPEGYQENIRYCDEDLNRAFIRGVFNNNIEGKRAEEIRRFLAGVQSEKKVLLDLHSVSNGNFKMAAYSADNPKDKQLALAVSSLPLHFSYHAEHLPGTIAGEASLFGFETLAIECGNHESNDSIDTATRQMNNLFEHYALFPKKMQLNCSTSESKESLRRYVTIARICPGRNFKFLDEQITSEWFLKSGGAFAWDEDKGLHLAPTDCYIMMPSKVIKQTDHDAGFLCTREE